MMRSSDRIAVLGSLNIDLVATTARIPAAGETVAGLRSMQVPGGKGLNQAVAAARAGARVSMLGSVGDDAFGVDLLAALAQDGIDTAGVATVRSSTGTANILVEDRTGENRIVVVAGANAARTELWDEARSAIAASSMLLLQLEVPPELVARAAAYAVSVGTQVVLTPAPVTQLPDGLLADVDLLVLNQHEAGELAGSTDPVRAAQYLRRFGVGAVIVTLGEDGCVLVNDDGERRVGAVPVRAADTTAAGDTFVGAFAAARVSGRGVYEALRWATSAAAVSVQHPGASSSMPYEDEILATLDQVIEVQ